MDDEFGRAHGQEKVALRQDAQRRRDRLVRAAVEVFLEDGVDVPLEKIADRAKVGRATLYRNFADRSELLVAAEQVYLDDFRREVVDCPGDEAFFVGIRAVARLTIATNGFEKSKWMQDKVPVIHATFRRGIEQILAEPLERAKRAGLVREDFDIANAARVALMVAGGALHNRLPDPGAAIDETLALLREGLAPPVRQSAGKSRGTKVTPPSRP